MVAFLSFAGAKGRTFFEPTKYFLNFFIKLQNIACFFHNHLILLVLRRTSNPLSKPLPQSLGERLNSKNHVNDDFSLFWYRGTRDKFLIGYRLEDRGTRNEYKSAIALRELFFPTVRNTKRFEFLRRSHKKIQAVSRPTKTENNCRFPQLFELSLHPMSGEGLEGGRYPS